MRLPIEDVEDQIIEQLKNHRKLVISAPPGAGKTTRVPIALLEAGLARLGRILMLEPRRIAARASAQRIAANLGTALGQSVGLRMRSETKTSSAAQIEVITEGVLTRMIHNDPELTGVSVIIFDEFHERSLHADTGLAMALDIQSALRSDLYIVVMSATLHTEEVVRYMSCPLVQSAGKSFDVDIRYLPQPPSPHLPIESVLSRELSALTDEISGGVLVFLPGEREIRAAQNLLQHKLDPKEFDILPLYAALGPEAQRAALAPSNNRRKVVLATSIAETSITIPDVNIVIDSGLTRTAEFDIRSQMSRLITTHVSRAEAQQRAGRAGRVRDGVALRLWAKASHGALIEHRPPEIARADITALVLDIALWTGKADGQMPWLTTPPEGPHKEAMRLLQQLGALDDGFGPTAYAHEIAQMPLHPRLAHALIQSGKDGAKTVALLTSGDPMRRANIGSDGAKRLIEFDRAQGTAWHVLRQEARQLRQKAPENKTHLSAAQICALAYPDQIGMRRGENSGRFILSNGKGVIMRENDDLRQSRFIALANHNGQGIEPKVRLAFSITEAELKSVLGSLITHQKHCIWSKRKRKIEAVNQECLGTLILHETAWNDPPPEARLEALREMLHHVGLPWNEPSRKLAARLRFWDGGPSIEEGHLIDTAHEWFFPFTPELRSAEGLEKVDLSALLIGRLSWKERQEFEGSCPAHYQTPLGRKITIDYSAENPGISLRLQELFGETHHPTVAGRALRITLLSPAQRAVQTTMDLPGFWANSYFEVSKEMRGRYPKHPWPDDPTSVPPTLRAKKRSG